jgi:hypothetical protein
LEVQRWFERPDVPITKLRRGAAGRIKPLGERKISYVIDLDPTHLILRSSTTGGGLAPQKSAVC